jgi:hypothetical protein
VWRRQFSPRHAAAARRTLLKPQIGLPAHAGWLRSDNVNCYPPPSSETIRSEHQRPLTIGASRGILQSLTAAEGRPVGKSRRSNQNHQRQVGVPTAKCVAVRCVGLCVNTTSASARMDECQLRRWRQLSTIPPLQYARPPASMKRENSVQSFPSEDQAPIDSSCELWRMELSMYLMIKGDGSVNSTRRHYQGA